MTELKLLIVRFSISFFNLMLAILEILLFGRVLKSPKNILVYKVGNIGDTVCAVPSLLAIREHFKNERITFLTSPGSSGAPGAKELLMGSSLFNEMIVYYSEDIDSKEKRKLFLKNLKGKKFDLFIELPEDLTCFRTMVRNMIFARGIGIKRAFGFLINSSRLFKKAQVDSLIAPQETLRLLNLLARYGIKNNKIKFLLPTANIHRNKIYNILESKFKFLDSKVLITVNPGGKREANCWPKEKYRDLALNLYKKYQAYIVALGADTERDLCSYVLKDLPKLSKLNACGAFSLLETTELLRHADLLISNSTGTIHIAAAVGTQCVGIYTIRDIPGKWSPYGSSHKVLYHLNFPCNYSSEKCIKKSAESVTLEEAIKACDEILEKQLVKSN